jgi:hypothetical protein
LIGSGILGSVSNLTVSVSKPVVIVSSLPFSGPSEVDRIAIGFSKHKKAADDGGLDGLPGSKLIG